MITSLTSRNHRDFQQRYGGTFGWLHTELGKKRLVQIVSANNTAVYFNTGGKEEYHAVVDSNVKFEFIPVTKGWYNSIKGDVLFLERVPERMWHRGIHPQNTRISSLSNGTWPGGQRINYALLSSIFVEDYDPWEKVDHTARPIALSKAFAISSSDYFMFYDQKIGIMKKDTIVLDSNIVLQEVQDMIKRGKYPFKVEVK